MFNIQYWSLINDIMMPCYSESLKIVLYNKYDESKTVLYYNMLDVAL